MIILAKKKLILPTRKIVRTPRPCFKPWIWVPRKPTTGALALDATGTESFVGTSPTSVNYNGFTMGAVSNGAFVVILILGSLSDNSVAMTWNVNQSPAQIIKKDSPSSTGSVQLWGLVNPTAGNKTLAITGINAATADIYIDIISFSGVDQTGGATTFYGAVSNNGTGTAMSAGSATTSSGDATVGAAILLVGGSITARSLTSLFEDGSGSISEGAAQHNEGSASPAVTWTNNGASSPWAAAATSVKAAAASTVVFRRSLSAIGTRTGSRQIHG